MTVYSSKRRTPSEPRPLWQFLVVLASITTVFVVLVLGLTTACGNGSDLAPASGTAGQSPSVGPSPSPTLVATTAPPPSAVVAPTTKAAPAPRKTTAKPAPKPTTRKPAPPPAGPPTHSGAVKPGAFCKQAEEGWIGYSSAGKEYVCRDLDNDGHPHWAVP